MNKENLLRTADFMRARPETFSMYVVHGEAPSLLSSKCGTVACIAGYASALYRDLNEIPAETSSMYLEERDGQRFLGLDYKTAEQLFYPGESSHITDLIERGLNPYNATSEQAARVVEHLAETGRVDWRVAFEEN